MRIYADLHIHSHYSRATSGQMNIEELSKYAKIKGVNLLGTGDFTHPHWAGELKEKLTDAGSGIYTYGNMNFMLSAEISLILIRSRFRFVRLLRLDKGDMSFIRFHERSSCCSFVQYSSPVRSVIFFLPLTPL